jgi:hypothetical protein
LAAAEVERTPQDQRLGFRRISTFPPSILSCGSSPARTASITSLSTAESPRQATRNTDTTDHSFLARDLSSSPIMFEGQLQAFLWIGSDDLL